MKTALRLKSLCVPRVATTPGALGMAITRYAGNHLLGTSPAPKFLQQIEQDGVIRIHPFAEHDKGMQTLALCSPEGAAFRQADFEARREMLLAQYTDSQLTYSSNLIDAYESGSLPRIVAVTVNPDELDVYAQEIIGLWERFIDDNILNNQTTIKQIKEDFPGFAATCNGIVVDQFEGAICHELQTSAKITRFLADLKAKGPVIEKALMETIFRIGPLQAAARANDEEGHSIYLPRKIGSMEVAGGTPWLRNTARYLLDRNFDAYRRSEGDLYHINYVSRPLIEARAVDYVKAMFTININALAIVLSLRDSGEFIPVTMGDMANIYEDKVRAYAEAIFDIAYTAGYMTADNLDFHDEFETMIRILRYNAAHPTSSVVMVQQLMQAGKLSRELGPNEVAIFEPAITEAERWGLHHYARLLVGLKTELMETLERLAAAQ